MANYWTRFDIEFEELLSLSFEDATERFRSQGPAVLITPIETRSAGAFYVANLLSPIGKVFWAAPIMPCILRHRLFGGARRPDEFKSEIRALLRRASRARKSRRIEWLGSVLTGRDGQKYITLCNQLPAEREIGRQISCVPHGLSIDEFLREQNEQLAELGEFAFYGADERTVMVGDFGQPSLLGSLFSGIDVRNAREIEDAMNRLLLAKMKHQIRLLEAGVAFSFQMEPGRVVHAGLLLNLPFGNWSVPQQSKPHLMELLSCRARLVHLLGWPSHFPRVLHGIRPADYGWHGPAIRDYNANTPYDAAAELDAYLSEMCERYPVSTRAVKNVFAQDATALSALLS